MKTTLNAENRVLESEVAIDTFTTGMGAYTGSITVDKSQARRMAFAINTANLLLYNGQTDGKYIMAVIRHKDEIDCPCFECVKEVVHVRVTVKECSHSECGEVCTNLFKEDGFMEFSKGI